jgi:hypothetical protein
VLASPGGSPPETNTFLAGNGLPVTTILIPGSNASTPDAAGTQAQAAVVAASTPATMTGLTATQNSSAINVTFNKPVFETVATPGDFAVTVAGLGAAPVSSVAVASSSGTASPTVTINVSANWPTAANPNVSVVFSAASGNLKDTGGLAAGASNASGAATALTGTTSLTGISVVGSPTGTGMLVTATFNHPVGLCTGAATPNDATVDAHTTVTNNVPPATTQVANPVTGAASVTNTAPTGVAHTIVTAAGSSSSAIDFTITTAILTGATVNLSFDGTVFNNLCDLNSQFVHNTPASAVATAS